MFYFKELFIRFQYFLFSFLITLLIVYYYKRILFILLTLSLIDSSSYLDSFNQHSNFIYTSPTELLTIHLLSILSISFIVQTPYFFWHLLDFMKSSLIQYEFRKLVKVLISLFLTFVFFNFLTFNFVFPKLWAFFQKFNILVNQSENLNFSLELTVQDYFIFVLDFLYFVNLFVIIFYLLLLLILVFGLENFIYWKKLFIFINIVFATLLSPPDVYSQIVILIFLSVFLEFILFVFIFLSKLDKTYLIRHHIKRN